MATSVGSLNPLEDFQSMLTVASATDEAMNSMIERIAAFINDGGNKAFYKKAVTCLKALRDECIKRTDAETFNDFLRDGIKAKFSKGKHGEVWEMLQEEDLSLITSEEIPGDSDVTPGTAVGK